MTWWALSFAILPVRAVWCSRSAIRAGGTRLTTYGWRDSTAIAAVHSRPGAWQMHWICTFVTMFHRLRRHHAFRVGWSEDVPAAASSPSDPDKTWRQNEGA